MNWSDQREQLGQLVRAVWIEWAKEQPAPKPSWLVPWDGLSEPDREVDRRIGEAIATRAVELVAARGGTMRASDLKACLDIAAEDVPQTVERIRQHVSSQGARIAALEAERDDLRLRLAALEVAGAKLSEHVDKTAGGDLTTVEVARNAIGMPDDMDLICIACEQCTVHRWMPSPGWRCSECSALSKAGHYPCSTTCTHDDAATPGHPERIRELSERMKRFPDVIDSKDERHPERVKERGETFDGAAHHVACPPSYLRHFSIGHIHDDDDAMGGGTFSGGFDAGFDKGAEAMRAQIRADVAAECDRQGLARSPAFKAIIAAIEGATP